MRQFSVEKWRQMVLGLAVIAVLAGGRSFAQQPADAPPWAMEKAILEAPAEKRDAWEKAWGRIKRFERDADEALYDQLKTIDAVYDDAKPRLRPFAQQMTGVEAKLRHAGGIAEKFIGDIAEEINRLAGGTPHPYKDWSDRFDEYARDTFTRMVLDPERLKPTVQAAATGYLARLEALENGVLVDLGADLPDGALGPMPEAPAMRFEFARVSDPQCFILGLSDDSAFDIASYATRSYLGDKVAEKLTRDQPAGLRRTATRFAVGNQIEGMLGEGMKMAGIDPEEVMLTKLAVNLRSSRASLVGDTEGDRAAYVNLAIFARAYPDADARAACGEAQDLMADGASLGLLPRLKAMYLQRLLALRAAVYRSIFGEAAEIPTSVFLRIACPSREDTLTWAETWRKRYAR